VMQFELPGDFLGGIDKAKLYLDRASQPRSAASSTPSFMVRRAACGAGCAGRLRHGCLQRSRRSR
jgi:hypothetical protein